MEARLFHLEVRVASMGEARILVKVCREMTSSIFDQAPFRVDTTLRLARYWAVEVIVNEEQSRARMFSWSSWPPAPCWTSS